MDETIEGIRDTGEFGLETPDADAAEQHTVAAEEPTSWTTPGNLSLRFDVDEADVADQDRAVELDEDDYR